MVLTATAAAHAAGGPQSVVGIGIRGPTTGPAPFAGVAEPNIAAAEAALGQHIPRPHSCAANDRAAWSVVVDMSNRWVAITYRAVPASSGCLAYVGSRTQVVVELRGRFYATNRPLEVQDRREVRALGRVASLVHVHGNPAVVLEGNFPGDCGDPSPGEDGCAGPQNNPTALLMQFGRTNVTVYGSPWWVVDDAVAVASTFR